MKKKTRGKLVFACIILILTLVILYSGLQILESAALLAEQSGKIVQKKTIVRDGVSYFPRQDINVIMLLGVDQEGEVKACEPNRAEGVDMVALLVVDEKNQEMNVLTLNRDTMLNVSILDLNGKPNGTTYNQLTMSHMYGTGLEDSCENTRRTVSAFLYGVTIDHYIAINYDAIPLLNDAVGGVTVNIEEDFSLVDPSIKKGTMKLQGQQALTYVQDRRYVGDEMNVSRMNRQEKYMESFAGAFRQKAQDSTSFVLTTYEQVAPYLVTDCSPTVISDMIQRYAEYEMKEIVTPEGENILGEQYMEFYVDEEKLDELILRFFYAEK